MIKRSNKKGFTLVEMVTALALVGVFISFFYTLFFNWGACEQFIARADFGQDMDNIIDQIAQDGRNSQAAKNFIAQDQAVFTDPNGNVSTYTITNAGNNTGVFTIAHAGNPPVVISQNIDFANSNFLQDPNGSGVIVTLAMTNQIFGQPITLNSQTEIYPRN